MRLPGVDGNTSIKRLSSVHPDLKFVVHTGSIDYSVPDDLKHLGISESCLFQKPVPDMGQLADAIRALAR
ncbi:MAG: response regulator, partial [Pseudomonadota bacterium]|nr:response regulator [Pseudomonadota bacterium]